MDPQLDPVSEVVRCERTLACHCPRDRVSSPVKGKEQGVSLGVDLDPALGRQRLSQQSPVGS